MKDLSQYEGEWNIRTNLSHGRGCRIWEDGSIYEGWLINGKASGKGRLITVDGHIYTGYWANDKFHGYGESIQNYGSSYN